MVLVHKLDRLARNVADHAAIRAILAKRNVRVVSVSENLEDSISGHLVENILAAINEFYSANLAQEVRKGMRQKVLQGGWPHQAPKGYRSVADEAGRRHPVPDLVGAPAIRWAFEQYAFGDLSLRQISKGLEQRGIRTVKGNRLTSSQIQSLLSNPFYMGRIAWCDLNVPGRHESLISPELFEQVQHIPRKRQRWTGVRGQVPGFRSGSWQSAEPAAAAWSRSATKTGDSDTTDASVSRGIGRSALPGTATLTWSIEISTRFASG